MTGAENRALAREIEIAIGEVAGAVRLYRSGSLVTNAVARTAAALGLREADEPLVVLVRTPDGMRVEAAIGVTGADAAARTLHAVQERVRAVLDEADERCAGVVLTVAHLQG